MYIYIYCSTFYICLMCWMESGFFFFRTPWYTLPKHKDQSSAGQYLWEILYVPQYGQTRAPQKNCLKFKAPGCVGVRQLYLSLSRPPPGLTVETVQLFCPHVSVVREREREGKSRSLNFFPLLALSFRPTLKALPEPTHPRCKSAAAECRFRSCRSNQWRRGALTASNLWFAKTFTNFPNGSPPPFAAEIPAW